MSGKVWVRCNKYLINNTCYSTFNEIYALLLHDTAAGACWLVGFVVCCLLWFFAACLFVSLPDCILPVGLLLLSVPYILKHSFSHLLFLFNPKSSLKFKCLSSSKYFSCLSVCQSVCLSTSSFLPLPMISHLNVFGSKFTHTEGYQDLYVFLEIRWVTLSLDLDGLKHKFRRPKPDNRINRNHKTENILPLVPKYKKNRHRLIICLIRNHQSVISFVNRCCQPRQF